MCVVRRGKAEVICEAGCEKGGWERVKKENRRGVSVFLYGEESSNKKEDVEEEEELGRERGVVCGSVSNKVQALNQEAQRGERLPWTLFVGWWVGGCVVGCDDMGYNKK